MPTTPDSQKNKRVRLSRADRLRQLIDVSWDIIRQDGTDALTLPNLALRAQVAKPVVYDHFGTRNGLLARLYQDFDQRQTARIDIALAGSGPTLRETATVIATSYISCVFAQGQEIPGVLAALAGSPELETIKREYQRAFIARCRTILTPFSPQHTIRPAALWAMLGAADTLSAAAASGEITLEEATGELSRLIMAIPDSSAPGEAV